MYIGHSANFYYVNLKYRNVLLSVVDRASDDVYAKVAAKALLSSGSRSNYLRMPKAHRRVSLRLSFTGNE